jgi:hypothetical protein
MFLSCHLLEYKNLLTYCYILGFLDNMTYAPYSVSLVTQQLKQRRYYGYGVVIYRETSYEVESYVRELVEFGRKHASLYRGRWRHSIIGASAG